MRPLHIDLHGLAGTGPLAQIGRGEPQPLPPADLVAHRVDGQRHPAGQGLDRGGDGIEPWLQRFEGFDEDFRVGPDAGKLLQDRHDVQMGGIAVRVFAGRERPRLGALGAAGQERHELEQLVGRRREREILDQQVAQRLAAHRRDGRGADQRDDLVDEPRIVAGEDAEGVADHIVEPAVAEVEFDMEGLFLRAFRIEPATRQEARGDRRFARPAGHQALRGLGRRAGRGRGGQGGRRRRRADLRSQRFQHAQRLLAARHAQIEPLLRLAGQRIGIVGAVVAALPAILLRHGRHQARRDRLAVGKPHAFVERHGGIMPGRGIVAGERRGRRSSHIGWSGDADRAGHAAGRECGGKETGEPGALLGRERRALRHQGENRRRRLRGHSAASGTIDRALSASSGTASASSAAMSWRRVKAWKPSSGPSRWVR